jgi:hypothetical protein
MAKIERFEDIVSWQKARELTNHIHEASNQGGFARDFGLRDQIRRLLAGFMDYLHASEMKGRKFRDRP